MWVSVNACVLNPICISSRYEALEMRGVNGALVFGGGGGDEMVQPSSGSLILTVTAVWKPSKTVTVG